jgi:stage IV sporulation protein FB
MGLLRIRGIDILISPAVIIMAAAAVYFGYFSKVLILTVAVLLHEAAHSFIAGFLGYRLEEINLFPLGGEIRIGGMFELDPGQEILIALAGPVMNVFMASFALWLKPHSFVNESAVDFFIAVNVVTALFNLFPALPMDGGRILRALLSYRWGTARATRTVWLLGKCCAGLLALLALYRGLKGPLYITMLAAAVFLFFAGAGERNKAASLMINQVGHKKSLLRKRGLIKSKTLAVACNASGKKVIKRLVPGYYHIVYVIGTEGQVLGRVGEQEILNGVMKYGYNVKMIDIVKMYNT